MNKKDLETFFNQRKLSLQGKSYIPLKIGKWENMDGTSSIEVYAEGKEEPNQTVWLPFEKWITLENDSR